MTTSFTVGAAMVTRIEETYEPNFDAAEFFPDWRPEVVQQHQGWMLPHHHAFQIYHPEWNSFACIDGPRHGRADARCWRGAPVRVAC